MTNKRWTYHQITAAAEKNINTNAKLASEARANGEGEIADIFAAQAAGAFALWDSLTAGWQKDDAATRLVALAQSAKHIAD